jgi:hypothetical protein
MKLWRLLINVLLVVLACAGVVWNECCYEGATVLGATAISVFASLGAALAGEFIGIVAEPGDFCKKSYFISVAVGVVFAIILSFIVL